MGEVQQRLQMQTPGTCHCPLFAGRHLADPELSVSPSPLAMFRYEPRSSGAEVTGEAEGPGNDPCCEHTDYTLVSLIPDHMGPGLELLDMETFSFRDVTELAPKIADGQRWVLCFAGLLGERLFETTAVTHCVRGTFSSPRRSCVFFYYPEPKGQLPERAEKNKKGQLSEPTEV